MKYLTTNINAQVAFAKSTGYIPVNTIAQNSQELQGFLLEANKNTEEGIKALSMKVAIDQSDMYFSSPAFYGSSYARDEVGLALKRVLLGKQTAEQALNDAVDKCVNLIM